MSSSKNIMCAAGDKLGLAMVICLVLSTSCHGSGDSALMRAIQGMDRTNYNKNLIHTVKSLIKPHQITKLKRFSFCLAVVFTQSIEARC